MGLGAVLDLDPLPAYQKILKKHSSYKTALRTSIIMTLHAFLVILLVFNHSGSISSLPALSKYLSRINLHASWQDWIQMQHKWVRRVSRCFRWLVNPSGYPAQPLMRLDWKIYPWTEKRVQNRDTSSGFTWFKTSFSGLLQISLSERTGVDGAVHDGGVRVLLYI